ncbi:MAG: OmpA family protein, partial [Planctomycetota bacterium]
IRLALALLILLAGAARAEEEEFTPEFGALEGATLTHSLDRSFDSYDLPIGPLSRDARPVLTLEGEVRELVYRLDDETSTLEAIRNYEARLTELGYDILFECAGNECGGFDFRFGVYLVDPPAMRFDLADFRYLGAVLKAENRHVSIIASRQGGKLFVQVVTVDAATTPASMTTMENAPRPGAKPAGARLYALARRLTEDGHAPLDGVTFEPGSARLTVESSVTLDQAARLLRARPDLKFLVVGHTDNEGSLEANLKLSRARAEAVAAALAAHDGVSAAQLEPHGVGFLAPRANNADPEGRALNRRVELVLK